MIATLSDVLTCSVELAMPAIMPESAGATRPVTMRISVGSASPLSETDDEQRGGERHGCELHPDRRGIDQPREADEPDDLQPHAERIDVSADEACAERCRQRAEQEPQAERQEHKARAQRVDVQCILQIHREQQEERADRVQQQRDQ